MEIIKDFSSLRYIVTPEAISEHEGEGMMHIGILSGTKK